MEELQHLQDEMRSIKEAHDVGSLTLEMAMRVDVIIARIAEIMHELTPSLEQASRTGDKLACKTLALFDRRLAAFADLPPSPLI